MDRREQNLRVDLYNHNAVVYFTHPAVQRVVAHCPLVFGCWWLLTYDMVLGYWSVSVCVRMKSRGWIQNTVVYFKRRAIERVVADDLNGAWLLVAAVL